MAGKLDVLSPCSYFVLLLKYPVGFLRIFGITVLRTVRPLQGTYWGVLAGFLAIWMYYPNYPAGNRCAA